jgi:hypothetical protein
MTRLKSIRFQMSEKAQHRVTRRAVKQWIKRGQMESRQLLKLWHNYPTGFLKKCVRADFR